MSGTGVGIRLPKAPFGRVLSEVCAYLDPQLLVMAHLGGKLADQAGSLLKGMVSGWIG